MVAYLRRVLEPVVCALSIARALSRRAEGQTLVEYALVLLGLAVLVVAVVSTLAKRLKTVFQNVASAI